MNDFNIKDGCKALYLKLQQKYPEVTEHDLNCNNGSEKEKMLNNLEKRIGKTRDELNEIIYKL